MPVNEIVANNDAALPTLPANLKTILKYDPAQNEWCYSSSELCFFLFFLK